ncbi:MAG TPA: protein kinase [Thermoanaerobaculia bacterium]|nr:protein kinase [Thermoanaerobaculia bacterium]
MTAENGEQGGEDRPNVCLQEEPCGRASQPASSRGRGDVIGARYRLEERLGEGALGVVHRAVHLGLEKSFAIKLLKTAGAPDPGALARFRREALALGRLRHPRIVEVTDSGVDEPAGGTPYLVMELLEGVPLAHLCRRQGPLPPGQALALLAQIADAVDVAHGAGILHRDLKPGNVFVCAGNPLSPRLKVLDFGLAELLAGPFETAAPAGGPPKGDGAAPSLTATGALPGTPLYAAPEVIRHGEAGLASDIYSFGVIAYELLGGRPPFEGTVAEVLAGHLESEPPPLPLAPEVWRALREPLQKDPVLRPRSASEVVRRLREGMAQAERARWRSAEVPRRARMAALLTAALLGAGLVLPWPPLPGIERRIDDLRVQTSPARAPDPRILLVTLDEASLGGSPLSLADRGDEIGRTLSRILDAGARGVAIDVLLHAKWSASPGFSDLLLHHSRDLTLAAFSEPDGTLVGTECVDGLTAAALGPHRASQIFGFVNLDEDRDGAVRRGRLWFHDRSGSERPSWAARAARDLDSGLDSGAPRIFWIDTRIDWLRYERISWKDVPAALDRHPGLFRDRLVLVGGDFHASGDDSHQLPQRSGKRAVSGLTLQALMVDTIAAGLPIREPARTSVLAASALAAFLAMAAALCAFRVGPIAAWLAAGAALYMALSFPAFWWTGLMLPVTAPLLVVLLGFVAALVLRRLLPSPPEVSAR